ncbi:hypothetical protein SEEH6457_02136, partial [Salmonella enterica subsp. enterica serovar Heidelberg str. N26457]
GGSVLGDGSGGVFPAPAGINRRANNFIDDFISVPRASGDKPPLTHWINLTQRCSPRQRG